MNFTFSRCSQQQVAAIHGVTPRTIRDWDNEGHPRNQDGTYDSVASIDWRMHRSAENLILEAERARLAKEQADKTALDNAVRRGELLEASTVEKAWSDITTAIRARALSLPTKVAAELAPMTDANRIRERLEREVHEILSEAAAYRPRPPMENDPEDVEDFAGDTEAPADPDGEPVGGRKAKAKPRKQRRTRSVAH